MKFIHFILLIAIANAFQTTTEAFISFSESNVELAVPNKSDFKGHVGLVPNGIIISSNDILQDQKVLNLVAETYSEPDSYIIDYRLFKSCDINTSIVQDKLRISFSPISLENRNKVDNFDISLDITNYNKLFEGVADDQIGLQLKSKCQGRKKAVAELKEQFTKAVEEYKTKYTSFADATKQLRAQTKQVEEMRANVQETKNQLKDITSLKETYQTQLKSIDNLTLGANKIITNENQKSKELETEGNKLRAIIKETTDSIKQKEEAINKLKESNINVLKRLKDIENTIINLQKDLAEVDGTVANIKSTKLGLDYDLKTDMLQTTQLDKSLSNFNIEIEKLEIKSKENKNRSEAALKAKNDLDKMIIASKNEAKAIEEQINQLIVKKSQIDGSTIVKYEQLYAKKEEIENLRLENEQVLLNIKRMTLNKENIEKVEKVEAQSKIDKINREISKIEKRQSDLSTKQSKINRNLSDSMKTKDNLQQMQNKNNKDVEKLTQDITNLNNSRIDSEKRLSQITTNLDVETNKVTNLRTEAVNYDTEKSTIKKQLSIAEENYNTFEEISNEFTNKLNTVQTGYNQLSQRKNNLEIDMNTSKAHIKKLADGFRKETPSAIIILDMAEDEALNDDAKSTKWKVLIDKIIN
jgi:chromosome segregation ATPase